MLFFCYADMALQMLLNSSNDPTTSFTITIPPNVIVTPLIHRTGSGRAVPSNCDMPTEAPSPTTSPTCPPPVNIQEQLRLKDREIIGIGIGLLFGGMIIGSLITLLVLCVCRCVCRRRSYGMNRSVQYKKHDDDIAFPT